MSEVARLKEQIDRETQAAFSALYGYADSSKHEYITARMEHLGILHDQLKTLIGEEADRFVLSSLQKEGKGPNHRQQKESTSHF